MDKNEVKKFVYEDDGQTKVIKGLILEEDEFTFKIKADVTNQEIVLGKRAIIKIYGAAF